MTNKRRRRTILAALTSTAGAEVKEPRSDERFRSMHLRSEVPRRGRVVVLFGLLLLLAIVGSLGPASAARAAGAGSSSRSDVTPSTAVPLASWNARWSGNRHVPKHRLTPRQAIALAARPVRVQAWRRAHPGLTAIALPYESARLPMWDVSWGNSKGPQVFVLLNDRSGRVTTVWTGPQAAWGMTRGYPWYAGNILGRWFVWVPLSLLFLLPFLDRRRPLRALHFDLLALLGFSASFFFFESGRVSVSVPLLYPVLGYLLARMLWIGFRSPTARGSLVPHMRNSWLVAGIAILVVLRIVGNLTDSTVLDVGSASAAGAHLLLHGKSLYDGTLGGLVHGGDTYGPVNYLAYVPFAALFPHDRAWVSATVYSHHPSAQLATITFDLLTAGGLMLLGRRLRPGRAGTTLGLALAYAWVAYPFSALALQENTNDSLLGALIVLTLLVLYSPFRRGTVLALATLAKFVPMILIPLIATGVGPRRLRSWISFAIGFGLTAFVVLLPFVSPGALRDFYYHTLGAQLHRSTPLSIWGQHPALHPLQLAAELGSVCLAVAVALVPRRRTPAQVAALATALVIAVQICTSYWYYPYIVWFAPAALVAMFALRRTTSEPTARENVEVRLEELPAALPVPEPVA